MFICNVRVAKARRAQFKEKHIIFKLFWLVNPVIGKYSCLQLQVAVAVYGYIKYTSQNFCFALYTADIYFFFFFGSLLLLFWVAANGLCCATVQPGKLQKFLSITSIYHIQIHYLKRKSKLGHKLQCESDDTLAPETHVVLRNTNAMLFMQHYKFFFRMHGCTLMRGSGQVDCSRKGGGVSHLFGLIQLKVHISISGLGAISIVCP